MIILSIETSCDETAISIVEGSGDLQNPSFKILGNSIFSQIDIHKEFGGVYPNLAKREHRKNLTPILEKTIKESGITIDKNFQIEKENLEKTKKILEREEGLFEDLNSKIFKNGKPKIDLISVTEGPGLAPALWVGVSFAKALSIAFQVPIIGVNHMKGHIASVLSSIENEKDQIENNMDFPAISLLISGGHTEIVFIEKWGKYKILGQTLDDAIGEAYDKTARMLGLSYPGGPKVAKFAKEWREKSDKTNALNIKLPRPIIHRDDLNFSFSGLKTAVLYTIEKLEKIDDDIIKEICAEFENAVRDVLIEKTKKALTQTKAKTLIIGGGVISNQFLRENFEIMLQKDFKDTKLKLPSANLSTDNSIMIAFAGYIEYLLFPEKVNNDISANGNLKITS